MFRFFQQSINEILCFKFSIHFLKILFQESRYVDTVFYYIIPVIIYITNQLIWLIVVFAHLCLVLQSVSTSKLVADGILEKFLFSMFF